ncbi:MAG: AMIN domain-containing protein [Synechococcales cyanobacterium RU_4_20]|nr:AMIN domain-containing protein [Synechococcales cyanobacterium RU_4_20]
MKPFLGFGSLAAASAIVVAAAQPTLAAPTEVTGVDIKQTSGGIELQLKTRFGDRPQVFSAPRGNSWVADVINTQLKLSGGTVFRQDNPAPGIASVQILPLDENSIRIVVTGTETLPSGEVLARNNTTLSFGVKTDSGVAAVPAQPAAPITAQGQIAQPQGQQPNPANPVDVLVPNPKVSIEGEPAVRQSADPAPPFLPRAVAPPVGDIAVSEINFQPTSVDLGTAVRIPRLVLREAPAREVLSLLARASGLNLAYSPAAGKEGQSAPAAGAEGGDEGPKISLDVENEPVQDVFNAVLRLSQLEGNRVNNTIFVSPKLPNEVKDIVVRTYRLNQVTADAASAFLASMGAERVITATVRTTEVETQELGSSENAPELTQTNTTESTELTTDRVELEDSVPVLRGTQVLADPRTNAITIVGPRNLVAIASAKITELDLRKRQVAVNVRILDINLSNLTRTGTSFSFGVAGTRFLTEGGVALFNFDTSGQNGTRTPGQGVGITPQNVGDGVIGGFQSGVGFGNVVRDFVAQLQANIQNGNAKVLTDPTVVVQEGETASVELTEEVVTNVITTVTRDAGGSETRTEVEKEDAGLTLAIQVNRIDDNGFINLAVSPSIKGISGSVTFPGGTITLLNERKLTSGTIRLRDGQGLILSGIIQDTDRNLVSKVPILGDLPLLGSLFRRTQRTNSRNEVIVLVTPQVLDDSDRSTFGYAYVPSSDARRALGASPTP